MDSQPILFSANPFVVANRRGLACLGGPPLGYGQGGVLKTSLCAQASALACPACCVLCCRMSPHLLALGGGVSEGPALGLGPSSTCGLPVCGACRDHLLCVWGGGF